MTAENDDEGQEDVLALRTLELGTPASPRGDGGEAGDERTAADAEFVSGETGDRSGGRSAEDIAAERPGLTAGEPAGDGAVDGAAAEELWKDGPVWTVQSAEPEIETAQRLAAAERLERAVEAAGDGGTAALAGVTVQGDAEWTVQQAGQGGAEWAARQAGRDGAAELAPEETRRDGIVQAGLEGLYRQTVQAARPAAPALPPEQAGRTARGQEPGSAASLAVDELDRAVRRDSRRYDGGMTIY